MEEKPQSLATQKARAVWCASILVCPIVATILSILFPATNKTIGGIPLESIVDGLLYTHLVNNAVALICSVLVWRHNWWLALFCMFALFPFTFVALAFALMMVSGFWL